MNAVTIDRFDSAKPCRVLLLTNPKAGSGARREQVPRLTQMLRELAIDCAITHTIDDLRRQLDSSRPTHDPVVVAAGGDGTVSLAASVISLLSDDRSAGIPLVPMPLGTENLLARHFGHNAGAESVIQTIRHGAAYRLDMGIASERPFLIMATCGFDAEVVRRMHLTRRGHIRRLSYLGPILGAIGRYEFPKIRIQIDDGQPFECCWAMVFNLPCYAAGLGIEPEAVGNDAMLDVIAFQHGSVIAGLKYVSRIWLGMHLNSTDVNRVRGSSIQITSDQPIPFQLDGDYGGRLPLSIRVVPAAAQLLLPPRR